MNRFDQIRHDHPDLGLTLYAIEPGGVVTLEVIAPDGSIFTFRGATADETLAVAFPPEPAEDFNALD